MRPLSLLHAIAIGELDHRYLPERFVKKIAESAALDDALLQRVCQRILKLAPLLSSSSSLLPEYRSAEFIADGLKEKSNRIHRIILALEDWVR